MKTDDMRYLFSALFFPTEYAQHIGLAYVAAALRQTGRYVSGFSPSARETQAQDLVRKICDENIDVVCFGALSAFYPDLKRSIAFVREHCPAVKIMVGGGIITAEPEFVATHLDMDFGCVGYGEATICEFADCLESKGDFSKVKGLIYKDASGQTIINSIRPEPDDLDSLPYPAYDLFGYVGREMSIIGSRSCPYNCTFCFHTAGYKYKQRSLESIFAEIDYWLSKYNIETIFMLDELMGNEKERAIEFCRRVKERSLHFTLTLRVDMITSELASVLADAGCINVNLGLESMCQTVLDSMRKKITTQQIEEALAILLKYHIPISGNFLFGDCVETYDTARETLNWWFQHHYYDISLIPVVAYPGTELYKYGLRTQRIKDRLIFLEEGCPPINLSAMSDAEYEKLCNEIHGLNILKAESAKDVQIETGTNEEDVFYGICPRCGRKKVLSIGRSILHVLFSNCHCGQKIKLPSEYKMMASNNAYFDTFDFEGKKLAVWGASPRAKFRLAANPIMKKAISIVVDRAHENFTERFLGFDVVSPYSLSAMDFDFLYIGTVSAREVLEQAYEILGEELNRKEILRIV